MEIKTVKRPLQDKYTKPEDIEYQEESWCVQTSMYREGDGGMKCWFEHLNELEKKGCNLVYLYSIIASNQKICNGPDEKDEIEDIIYTVRADYKIV